MKKQWIVGTALLVLMTGNVWADGEPPTENILKAQFKKQYHGILKLDAITLKNLDAKGNQATWSAEGDVSSSDDLYTWVGQSLPVTISIPGSVSWQITNCSNRPGRKINR